MEKTIDYYFSPSSPWSFLGHDRLTNIARKHFAKIKVKPIDFAKVFPATGGVPVAKRAPARQASEPDSTPVSGAPVRRLFRRPVVWRA